MCLVATSWQQRGLKRCALISLNNLVLGAGGVQNPTLSLALHPSHSDVRAGRDWSRGHEERTRNLRPQTDGTPRWLGHLHYSGTSDVASAWQ